MEFRDRQQPIVEVADDWNDLGLGLLDRIDDRLAQFELNTDLALETYQRLWRRKELHPITWSIEATPPQEVVRQAILFREHVSSVIQIAAMRFFLGAALMGTQLIRTAIQYLR